MNDDLIVTMGNQIIRSSFIAVIDDLAPPSDADKRSDRWLSTAGGKACPARTTGDFRAAVARARRCRPARLPRSCDAARPPLLQTSPSRRTPSPEPPPDRRADRP